MSNQIQNVLKQALITFTSKPEVFATNLQLLSAIVDKLTADDVKLDIRKLGNKDNPSEPGAAPVTYIDIYEDATVTMGIFVLKQNKKLPLHNHPEMHGLLKVLSGKVRIISYSINTSKTLEVDSQTRITDNVQRHNALKLAPRRLVTAELTSDDIVDSTCKSCLLEPNEKNIHEIHSVDGPAAFLDILAPPYMTEIPNSGHSRYCSYYSILSNVAPNVFRLQEIRNPPWYWTDTAPYAGPDPTVDLESESN
ncbi:unnamed protein product [Phyllotreta striolata]|uniref:2-aminoethanethiol dioxygenase n=1 Tax=Phyllotreta striolata TaxID=444603 RepID=A0A9N9U023_PHYSR|nr:unnamed protein product [Phyllotreta striolata]